jgi:hypothetical protein
MPRKSKKMSLKEDETPEIDMEGPGGQSSKFTNFLLFSMEKRLQGDLRAAVQQRTVQWLPGQVPMTRALPKKDSALSAGQVIHPSLFLRRALAGQVRRSDTFCKFLACIKFFYSSKWA